MDLEYFKEHICDELDGAKDYIIRAMEIKPMNPTWSKKLMDMAMVEMSHAATLYDLYNEYYKQLAASYSKMPDYIQEMHNSIIECYADCYPKVKLMHEMAMK